MGFYIKSSKFHEGKHKLVKKKIVVVACLYYESNLKYYCKYLKRIPDYIDLLIISSKKSVLKESASILDSEKHNIKYIEKKNRGRDVSALLVVARKYISEYDYFCFIHDKSPNHEYLSEDIGLWVDNIWDSMLASECYIENVIQLFEENEKLGAVFPPGPIGESLRPWFEDSWFSNYTNTVMLAEKLGLSVPIERRDFVVSLGTVLWGRTIAFDKLFSIDWAYTDFLDEPLPADGTVSHAIERILHYVVIDAGYETSYITNENCAALLLDRFLSYSSLMHSVIKDELPAFNMQQVRDVIERTKEIKDYVSNHKNLYIFGAGEYGKSALRFLRNNKFNVSGFLVTRNTINQPYKEDIPVIELSEYRPQKNDGIIVAVSIEKMPDIEKTLKMYSIEDYLYGF